MKPKEVLKHLKKKIDNARKQRCNYAIETEDIDMINEALGESVVKEINPCKHTRIESLQGGQIDRCMDCGETWG